MHLVLAVGGTIRARGGAGGSDGGAWVEAAGVLTAADAVHEIDARGRDVLLVFLDPESDAGAALASAVEGALRPITPGERDALIGDADPRALMAGAGEAWMQRAARALRTPGAARGAPRRHVHPRVRRLLRLLAAGDASAEEVSLEALAAAVGLSPGRLMHVFTASIGIPLRPYLSWLKLQRAAGAIVAGASVTDAAAAAGFADAPHMSRTFRRMFGVPPSQMRPAQRARPERPPARRPR
jgi:AraC-like DNA-binding protein